MHCCLQFTHIIDSAILHTEYPEATPTATSLVDHTYGPVGAPSSILTWHRGYRDHEGGSPRARPFHCTTVGLTLAITPNVGNSGA